MRIVSPDKIAGAALALVVGWVGLTWPVAESRLDLAPIASTRFVDRHGALLGEQVGPMGVRARPVTLEEVSPHFIQALLAVEDKRFFNHGGLDLLALGRAAYQNALAYRIVSGGSTLTQQLARVLLTEEAVLAGEAAPARSVWQKAREARLALRLERTFSKNTLLVAFINRAPFGNHAVGLAAAAERYFGTSAATLSLGQASFLAGLPKGPSAYNPYSHRQAAQARQEVVLGAMTRSGGITAEQRARALEEPLQLQQRTPHVDSSTVHARALAQELLKARQAPSTGTVALTLDAAVQHKVQDIVQEQIPRLYGRGGKSAAVVVLDNATGDVLALVGSAFSQNPAWGQFSAATAVRQPGSALKPFLYAAALEQGKTAASLAADIDRPYADTWGVYMPNNYDQRFHGPVRYREALAQSLNVAAVDVLHDVGLERAFTLLDQLGLKTLDRRPSYFGLGLALGSGGVRLVDLTNAYRALAQGGKVSSWRLLQRDEGAVSPPKRVISPQVAFIVSDILADANARTPQFGPHSVLSTPYWAAAKTGTSKGYRDNWTVGFTPQVTVGVWVGDPTGAPMREVSGVEGAGVIWRKVMNEVTGYRSERPSAPAGIVQTRVCPLSGQLVGPHCAGGLDEHFTAGTQPTEPCGFHRLAFVDLQDQGLVSGTCARGQAVQRQVTVFPSLFASWAEQNGVGMADRVTRRCAGATQAQANSHIRLISPTATEALHIDGDAPVNRQALELAAEVSGSNLPVTFFVDDQALATVQPPYRTFWQLVPGQHRIRAQIGESGPRSAEHQVWVR